MKKELKSRIHFFDELRGFAIVCMIVHHAFLDIGMILYRSWAIDLFNNLCYVQPLFLATFFIISGICSRLSRNSIKRGLIVFAFGIVIILITAVLMPKIGVTGSEIYFGVLSCLGSCMIISGVLKKANEKINFKIGMIITGALFVAFYGINNGTILFGLVDLPRVLYSTRYLFFIGLPNASFSSADYFPLIPWIFLYLFGFFAGQLVVDGRIPKTMYKKKSKILSFIGRNSLWVYLAHQPILYFVLYVVSFIELMRL